MPSRMGKHTVLFIRVRCKTGSKLTKHHFILILSTAGLGQWLCDLPSVVEIVEIVEIVKHEVADRSSNEFVFNTNFICALKY